MCRNSRGLPWVHCQVRIKDQEAFKVGFTFPIANTDLEIEGFLKSLNQSCRDDVILPNKVHLVVAEQYSI